MDDWRKQWEMDKGSLEGVLEGIAMSMDKLLHDMGKVSATLGVSTDVDKHLVNKHLKLAIERLDTSLGLLHEAREQVERAEY